MTAAAKIDALIEDNQGLMRELADFKATLAAERVTSAALRAALTDTLAALDACHPMDPEEPCSVYEDWVHATAVLEAEQKEG